MHDATPVAYASQPTETELHFYYFHHLIELSPQYFCDAYTVIVLWFQINYVSAHDNETLFDIISLKVITIMLSERLWRHPKNQFFSPMFSSA